MTEADVGDGLLRAQRGHDLALGVESDAEAPPVVGGHRLAEQQGALVRRVLVRGGVPRRLGEGRDDVLGCRRVGVADAEADDVDAGRPPGGDLALDLGEQVRRQALDALLRSVSSARGYSR